MERSAPAFFKPVAGHGSKGVNRGDKITRRVFEKILNGGYVAQDLVPAGERTLRIDDAVTTRKVDIRLYTYAGKSLLVAASIYCLVAFTVDLLLSTAQQPDVAYNLLWVPQGVHDAAPSTGRQS